MDIIEETTALGVHFCHFRTLQSRNQYNLTYTKTDEINLYEIHLTPLVILDLNNKIIYDRDLRAFICNKVYQFMTENNFNVYFNINCIGLGNEFLVWKFLRWLRTFSNKINVEILITEDSLNSIRFFEFTVKLK